MNDSGDKENMMAIRSHLSHIAMMFGDGDFSTPMFIHDSIPPGVTTMKLIKSAIHYAYEEMQLAAGFESNRTIRLLWLRFTTSCASRSTNTRLATVLTLLRDECHV